MMGARPARVLARHLEARTRGVHHVSLLHRALEHDPGRTAVVDPNAERVTYGALLERSAAVASRLLELGGASVRRKHIAFVAPASSAYVSLQWAIWRLGGVAVPLCTAHPLPELQYTVSDSHAALVCSTREYAERAEAAAKACGVPFVPIDAVAGGEPTFVDEPVAGHDPAMLVYTSGTTGRPKGVITTHAALDAQITMLVDAWEWVPEDRILHFLPLHHVHGIVNKLACALWAGACVEFMEFQAERVWRRLATSGAGPADRLSLFMAVPTIYSKLLHAWDREEDAAVRQAWSDGARRLRLMVSGSAPLPVPVLQRWKAVTGHTLLERYGMTEFGMALSNPLRPESDRLPGYVGRPMPGVQVRVVDAEEREVLPGEAGELRVKGENVFRQYWNKPEATSESFDSDGWFKTGDTAAYDPEVDSFKILGRTSVDVIKTGGYKVSALEIERVLLEHPDVLEAVVVGLADPVWGQKVGALVQLRDGAELGTRAEEQVPTALRAFVKERIAHYKVPSSWLFTHGVPRNVMGKVNKKALVAVDDAGFGRFVLPQTE